MQNVTLAARILLGLLFTAAGLQGLFAGSGPPADLPEKMIAFQRALAATGYFLPFLKLTETICGLLILTGVYARIGLVILAPISINIFLVHLFLTPGIENIILPVVILVLHVTAASAYWSTYSRLFERNNWLGR
jgi:uncharacterized membrane protein YphA (DoxX/SURF4 family)